MPLWRMSDEQHRRMREHDPFEHSRTPGGQPVVVPRFHFVPEGQPQHDGSWIVHMSHNLAGMIRSAGFEMDHVAERTVQFPEEYQEAARTHGIWSVWKALGGHRPYEQPPSPETVHQRLMAEKEERLGRPAG